MAAPYEPVIEEPTSEDESRYQHPELYFMQMPSVRGQRWPTSIGIVQLVLGFVISFLGLTEVLIVPITESRPVQFNHSTCYGAGLWAGLVMVLTGSTALRAAISRRKTTVFRFYNLTVFSLLAYTGLTVFLVVAYCMGWTTKDAYPPNSSMHTVHMFVTIMMVLCLLFALTAVVQYYQLSCCNDLDLQPSWWQRLRVRSALLQRELDEPVGNNLVIQ
ncbi:hypothetical protein ACOMHN_039405 [Nucella lapillus]